MKTSKDFANILLCPTCDEGQLDINSNYFFCSNCESKFPIFGKIPLLVKNSTEYIKQYSQFVNNELENLQNIKEDVNNHILQVYIKRLTEMYNQLQLFNSKEQISEKAIEGYLKKFATEFNNDQYVLTAYSQYLNNGTLASSENLYSSVVSMGTEIPKNSNILEIGCGVGRTLLDYSKLANEGLIIGLDLNYSKANISHQILNTNDLIPFIKTKNFDYSKDEIKGFGRNNVYLGIADAEGIIPIKKKSIDVILVQYLLGLLKEPQKFLENICGLLSENGIIIIADDHGWYENFREIKRKTNPNMVENVLIKHNFKKLVEFDTPWIETITDRYSHIHITRVMKFKKIN